MPAQLRDPTGYLNADLLWVSLKRHARFPINQALRRPLRQRNRGSAVIPELTRPEIERLYIRQQNSNRLDMAYRFSET